MSKKSVLISISILLVVVTSLSVVSCGQLVLSDVFSKGNETTRDNSTPTLTISPTTASLQVSASTTFAAAGGAEPYSYSVRAGGAGGTINATTGVCTAPSTTGTDTVRVTDSAGTTADATVAVAAAATLAISPSSLVIALSGTKQFSASGGMPPYTFSMYTGNGSITPGGLYTAPGTTSTDTVRVTDSAFATSSATVSVSSGGPVTISPAPASVAENGTITFTGGGGVPPYTFSLQSGSSGSIATTTSTTGTYTAPATGGASAATVIIKDSQSPQSTASTTIDVAPAAPSGLSPDPTATPPVKLSWTNNSGSATAIDVLRQTVPGGTLTAVVTLYAPLPSTWTDTGVTSGTTYKYQLQAKTASLVSAYSNQVTIKP